MEKIIIANWKMNPQSLQEAKEIFNEIKKTAIKLKKVETIICSPFVYLSELGHLMSKKASNAQGLGAQDIFYEEKGAYTGEISPKMLKNLGVEYVIVGHSERRKYLNETDEMINKKVLAALRAGLKVVLCIGENLSIRKRGKKAVEKLIKLQLKNDLKNSKFIIHNSKLRNHLVIAYEPVWAIGAKHSDTPQDAVEMIKFIKKFLISHFSFLISPKVLYGGSVDSKNIGDFLKHSEIDGVLVGQVSLNRKEIKKIIHKLR